MALHQDTIWEIRTGGNNENGGGFHDRNPGTSVDYSQQNAPQLDLTDLACAAASVTVTSVVGGFTQAMVGNIMRIHAGANFTVGFYEIVTWNSANSIDLDRVPVTGIGANGHGKIGGGQVDLDLIDVVVVPGNTIYIENGNYAAHPAVAFIQTFTRTLPLTIWGYDGGVRTTRPTGANRPVIQMGANTFTVRTIAKIRNISFEGTANGIFIVGGTGGAVGYVSFFENCKFNNTAVAGTVSCLKSAAIVTHTIICIDCEFLGTLAATSTGLSSPVTGFSTPIFILNCYFHSLTFGVVTSLSLGPDFFAFFSIFANIGTTGISCTLTGSRIINCTFEACGANGFASGGAESVFMNNSFSNCVNAGINSAASVVMNNNFFGCGTPWIGGTLDPADNNRFVNPQFITPGSNYADQRTSGLIDAGFSMRLGV